MNNSTQEQSDESTPLTKNEMSGEQSLINNPKEKEEETIKISNSLKWIIFSLV